MVSSDSNFTFTKNRGLAILVNSTCFLTFLICVPNTLSNLTFFVPRFALLNLNKHLSIFDLALEGNDLLSRSQGIWALQNIILELIISEIKVSFVFKKLFFSLLL